MMRRIQGRHTKPELVVRRHLHAAGLRYLLHDPRLPGRPDIVLPRYEAVVEVRGCFWHSHGGCRFATRPKSNTMFWLKKLSENVQRDRRNEAMLHAMGWRVLVVWECEVEDAERLDQLARVIRHRRPAGAVASKRRDGNRPSTSPRKARRARQLQR